MTQEGYPGIAHDRTELQEAGDALAQAVDNYLHPEHYEYFYEPAHRAVMQSALCRWLAWRSLPPPPMKEE
jgi:hypothetical protein